MSESDPTLELLAALGDVGLSRLDSGRTSARVGQAINQEIDRERRSHPDRRERRRRRSTGWALPAATTLVTLLVALGAVLLLGRSAPAPAASAQGLIARLAVLRRPQVAADRLPAGLGHIDGVGHVIPGLTRLVASPAGARLYLVVSTRGPGPAPCGRVPSAIRSRSWP